MEEIKEDDKNNEMKIYSKNASCNDEIDNGGIPENFESEEIYKEKTKKDDILKIRKIVKIFDG